MRTKDVLGPKCTCFLRLWVSRRCPRHRPVEYAKFYARHRATPRSVGEPRWTEAMGKAGRDGL
jgi:hypothetical protein